MEDYVATADEPRSDDEARALLADASRYPVAKFTKIESRLHYLRKPHGETAPA